MTFEKPTEWGCRFSFPENAVLEFDPVNPIVHKIAVAMAEHYDDAVTEAIAKAAKAEGITELTVLNKSAIISAIQKQIPKKPEFVDIRFRNHGRSVADGVSLSKCYKCPSCWSHIFHVWDSEKYCVHCGQALDWAE